MYGILISQNMGYSFNPFFILPCTALIFNSSLGVYVLLKNHKSPVNRLFALQMLFFSLWDISEVFLRLAADKDTALFWANARYLATLPTPFIALHFVNHFPERSRLLIRFPWSWILFYLPLILFYGLFVMDSSLFVEDIKENITPWGLVPKYGEMDNLYSLMFLIYSVTILLILHRNYKQSKSETVHNQMKYVFLGMVITLSYAMIFEFLLPTLASEGVESLRMFAEPPPLSSIFTVIMGLFFAFAIIKYKLMCVDNAIERSVAYLLITLTVAGIFVIMEEIAENIFSHWMPISGDSNIPGIIAALIVAYTMEPIKKKIEHFAEGIFPHSRSFR